MRDKPYWLLIKEAMASLGNRAVSYREIKDYIIKEMAGRYDYSPSTHNCQVIICTVNHSSRVHYPENRKPRTVDGTHQYDFLYQPTKGKGEVVLYDPSIHGVWEIAQSDDRMVVRQTQSNPNCDMVDTTHGVEETVSNDKVNENENEFLFRFENQLRDFIAVNLSSINKDMVLYTDENGVDGIEYRTSVGVIDILAQDKEGNFVVFELKLGRGPDATLGQLQRYMGWIKTHLADGKRVYGVIVAKSIDEKLKYAVSVTDNISLFEYAVSFDISKVTL